MSSAGGGTLALMSRPLWPEDMETLCPYVPLHMRHALAIYCNILLHIAIWPQPVGAPRIRSLSAGAAHSLVLLFLFLLFVFSSTLLLLFMCATFVPSPLSLFISPRLPPPRGSCRHDGIPRRTAVTPDLLPLLSAPPPRRHDVTIAAAALRLTSCLLMVKDDAFHAVSAYVTFMFPLWRLRSDSSEIHLASLSTV